MSYQSHSYRSHKRIAAWKEGQELAEKSRKMLRPLLDAAAGTTDPLDLDSLPVPDLTTIPDPLDLDSLKNY